MSSQNERLRAETEVNPLLQNAIVVHHIIQVVVIIIIGVVSAVLGNLMTLSSTETVIPIFLFVIFCIASKCNYQDLRLLLVHFNPILSTLWLAIILPVFVRICHSLSYGSLSYYFGSVGVMVLLIITGFLTLSSAIFAACGIWKSARNLVLSARSSRSDSFDPHSRSLSPHQDEPLLTP